MSVSRSLQIVAAAMLLLVAGVTVHQLITLRRSIVSDTTQQMARLDLVLASQTGRAVEAVDLIIRSVIDTYQSQDATGTAADLNSLLRRRLDGVPQLADVQVADASGRVEYAAHGGERTLPPMGLTALAYHIANPKAGLRISPPFRGADGKWTALLTHGIAAPDGKNIGIVAAYLNLAYFEDVFSAGVDLSENGSVILHLRDGTVLARSPHVDAAIGTSFSNTPPFKDVLAHSIAGTVLMESPIDGSIRVTAIRALPGYPLAVMISVEERRLLQDWRRQAWIFCVGAILVTVMIVGLLLLLSRRSLLVESLLKETSRAKDVAERSHQQALQEMADRERAEAALRQAQRIEAVGQLTGGVAHDFNNLLTVIIGNVDLLQAAGSQDERSRYRLAATRAAAEKGATLTSHLLAFARRQPLLPRAVDLNGVVDAMRDLLQSALGRRVQMEFHLADDLWQAMVDPTQIELVILNLAINARDAMPNGGLVTIETGNHHRGPSTRAEEPGEGDYVAVTVRDTGVGMSPGVLARAFEPFFTTKGPGAGSGLGLSQVFGTARQSGGDVHIDTVVGKGTSVSVFLPRATVTVERHATQPTITDAGRGAATVLVVDDDDAVRATTADVLNGLGYTVQQAADGPSALEILCQSVVIDAVLTDVVMPGMSGPELARRVMSLRPGLPIIFISGYAEPEGLSNESLGRLVRKPFRASELREEIEEALDQARAAPAA
ncbi:MAG TPA: response regulator [Acetobacteraceae bacterium]|nr:response regulator [Acetobacteraceae bacterium]